MRVYALSIVSKDKILRFINTVFISIILAAKYQTLQHCGEKTEKKCRNPTSP